MESDVYRRKGRSCARTQAAEWLTEYGFTIPEAIDRSGPAWVALIPKVARDLADEDTE